MATKIGIIQQPKHFGHLNTRLVNFGKVQNSPVVKWSGFQRPFYIQNKKSGFQSVKLV
jgi:hypothetical protein